MSCVFLLTACGAVMSPGPFRIPVDSVPQGAEVRYQGAPVGRTPCTVAVSRQCRVFELRLADYHPQLVEVGTCKNWWRIGNVVTLGIGMVVDSAAGTDCNPDTEPVTVYLHGAAGPAVGAWSRRPLAPAEPPDDPRADAIRNTIGLAAHFAHALWGTVGER